jgi:lysozyme
MRKGIKIIIIISIFISIILAYLFYNGYLWFNNPQTEKYPVRGLDVSNHQGNIDWTKVKKENLQFAFIKASEGMDYKDEFFHKNLKNAKANGFAIGAYHFFTFGSSGLDQAKNFISIVPLDEDMMPPVIDLEFVGNSKNIPTKEKLTKELLDFIYELEKTYNQRPILYLTYESYEKYIKDNIKEYNIWIRDIIKSPKFDDDQQWLLWQYSNRGKVNGIDGFVDLNVFNGSFSDFKTMLLQ